MHKIAFSVKKFVQPGRGIGIAAADSIGYRTPAWYRSNPSHVCVTGQSGGWTCSTQ